jgi:retron-type reverse transcriptase
MIARFALDLDANLKRLSEELRAESYRPQRIRRHYIPKPGSQEKRFGGRGKRDNRISLPLSCSRSVKTCLARVSSAPAHLCPLVFCRVQLRT